MSGKRYILEGAAQKIGLLRWKTENIFEHSRNNKKIVVIVNYPKGVLCFNVRMTKSANVLVRKIVKATKV